MCRKFWRWILSLVIPTSDELQAVVIVLTRMADTQDQQLLESKKQTSLLELIAQQQDQPHKAVKLIAKFGKPQLQ